MKRREPLGEHLCHVVSLENPSSKYATVPKLIPEIEEI